LRDTKSEKTALRFRPDGSFKIVQFTDLHYGEGEDVPWGPMQDVNSTRVMHKVCSLPFYDIVIRVRVRSRDAQRSACSHFTTQD
jgi:hypothetical protein